MIHQMVFQHMNSLPLHKDLCNSLLRVFSQDSRIDSAFISGSGASGNMDVYSDLDLGFVCSSNSTKEEIWQNRFEWDLPPWFHRMDADHVKPFFTIYLFEPHIHVDLAFYTLDNLPPKAGGPFTIAFDKSNRMMKWATEVNKPYSTPPDWSKIVHEEEQFWTWTHYSWCHSARGEYYDDASTFHIMRKLLQQWQARLQGTERFDTRRLEQRGEMEFIQRMRPLFPKPDRASMKSALLAMIEIHNSQRQEIERTLRPHWNTTQAARDKITRLVQQM